MTKELIAQFTSKLLQYAESAEMFAKTEAPKYITELLQYELYSSILYIVLFTVILMISIFMILPFIKGEGMFDRSGTPNRMFGLLFIGTLLIVISVPIVIKKTNTVIKITVAPRVFIVDHLRSK